MKVVKNTYWNIYKSDNDNNLLPDTSGKWLCSFVHFGGDYCFNDIEKICAESVEKNIIPICKHTSDLALELSDRGGMICFYLNIDDTDGHKKIIKYILDKKLIKRTKSGKLTNISFKLDKQTIDGKYGENFKATLKLSDFIDLITGEFII
ncbi:hypothetical protein [uncultured Cedecea sp.]|uniref:hypothetical protein n=1 Tax=uncultured Cedecea sp. TaxID=988762 RepID=UPI002623C58D|nr:hypothetical protein [uncultured Cedecea sp.]